MRTISSKQVFSLSLAVAVACTGLLVVSGCADNDDSLSPNLLLLNKEDYFPLQVGNYWELAFLPPRSIEITATIDNKEYFGLVSEGDTTYYRKTSDGKVYERTKHTPEILSFDLAADAGQEWTYKRPGSNYTWHATLVSKKEAVKVGDYTFKNCYSFLFDIPEMADEERIVWLAPGIGFIEESYPGGTPDRKVLTKAKIDDVEISF